MEELEDRLGHQMEDILSVVRASLEPSSSHLNPPEISTTSVPAQGDQQVFVQEEQSWDNVDDVEQVFDPSEVLFDDTGEGVGVEGDLDMEDD